MRLQQILLYRELGLPLEKIGKIVNRRDFDALGALTGHKEELRRRISHLERLIATVDSTILHLKGGKEMNEKKMFEAFDDERQAEYEKEAMRIYDHDTVKASNEKWRARPAGRRKEIMDEGNEIYRDILRVMSRGAASPEVQSCIERWRRHLEHFWTPTDEQLQGLADVYNDDPRFKANFDRLDHALAQFMREAVREYVRRRKEAK